MVLLDDGFQHRRLATGRGRGGGGRGGGLRQRPDAAARPSARAALRAAPGHALLGAAAPATPGAGSCLRLAMAPRVRTRYRPTAWVDPAGTRPPTRRCRGSRCWRWRGLPGREASCGRWQALGTEVRDAALFPDHHRFSGGRAARGAQPGPRAWAPGGDDGEGRGAPARGASRPGRCGWGWRSWRARRTCAGRSGWR